MDTTTKFNNLKQIMEYSSKANSDCIAFRIKEKVEGKVSKYTDVTYKMMGENVKALGTYLLNKGYGDERIVVIGDNCYEWIVSYMSIVSIGSVFVPLDKNLPTDELVGLLKRSEPSLVIYGEQFENIISQFEGPDKISFSQLNKCIQEGDSLISNGNNEYNNVVIDENKLSFLLFTSGTTSRSKAVMLSQRNIASNINGLVLHEEFYPNDVNLVLLPLHHIFGLVSITLFIRLGIMNVFCEGLRVAKALKEYKVTVLVAVPLILESIYRQVERTVKKRGMQKKLEFALKLSGLLKKLGIDVTSKLFSAIHTELGGSLRFIISGGAALRPELSKWFNNIGIFTVQGYGLSETSPVITAENKNYMRVGSVGVPMDNVKVLIDNPDHDGIGEIVVQGENVMLGYWNEPEMTDEVIRDNYFYTGDMGYIDKDGFVFITGRKKDVIVLSNGKNVFPNEIEQLVGELEYVSECMIFEYKKDSLAVNVVFDEGLGQEKSLDEIYDIIKADVAQINKKLIAYKRIRTIFASENPMIKTSTAKIKRIPTIEMIKNNYKPI